MANLTTDQANQLSENFYSLAIALGDFRVENWDRLTPEQRKELSDIQYSVIRCGEDILALSTTLVMDEVADSLGKINTISEEIKGTIKTLGNIQKGLNVAAAILILGVAIINRDTQGIGNSIKNVFETWSSPLS
ncbi:hypothetical protein SYJ56_07770 [Algoriphagus sp. D3-2-R+10]|uniref:hypothetical protein n=1 Tax=Algoriphagus aurantiacus TaxID=3103948 RepID=UPI002B3A94A9|nr:hypothetical protein [Algoriphagus sp. D3-2-R+10]MEB2775201.1 hypothetical protein [Algoriphagus sp. D3-2-R+10]